ncbi:MAG: CRISPR-associated endonuclease Cas3'' [Betaproteobacteria bacterium]|jgi:CRISPR-associated endonuclease/helicase Cas3|nr:CRISPR-associated endonuclease Cas3'' [Betaproteobacteria bacterium]MBK7517004.1 CRISPR-associated endonuclease Cas3'' [Betaproteobacteria bacterium]MCU0939300.1 CRISPR-associated endonuclease Cas3'' [Burkholderiaceae bacterium]
MNFIAHAPEHELVDHLTAVAQGAAAAVDTASAPWAHLAGLWHDLGKFRPGFQSYVRQDDEAHIEGRGVVGRDKTHSAAGAVHALQTLKQRFGEPGRQVGWLLAHLIAAHHAGLYDAAELQERLIGGTRADSEREHQEAVAACASHAPELLALPEALDAKALLPGIPGLREREPLAQSLWLRMLFSALVDADFLDTEAYLNRGRAEARAGFPPLADYLTRLDAHLDAMAGRVRAAGRAEEPVMRARARVLSDCRAAAGQPPGVFSLQVPTGGGKTLASLAFALRHAVAHGLQRVIVAIPYTSIVEQTADVLGGIFGRDNLVEHHSQADTAADRETARSRLACENWDAPLVVTTNVQLFESLFAARTSRCRKLHRVQRSVIILDEAQTLPPPFLQPTLDALRLLVNHYGATLVSCTATQPVLSDITRFDPRASLRGLTRGGDRPREIVQAVQPLYAQLERVRLHWPADLGAPEEIGAVAARLAAEPAALAIVNTRRDAADLVRALDAAAPDGEPTLHLSAAMCGQHRADVIARIRHRLDVRRAGAAAALRVVATQLVEAGVDIDFPVVFRALTGLDAIAQAAGRCNREGRLGARGGRVEVFVRPIPAMLAALVRAALATRAVLGDARPEALRPELFSDYFKHWYAQFSTDEKKVLPMLRASPDFDLRLRSAARAYRLIDDQDQVAVVVPYTPDGGADPRHGLALAALRAGTAERWHLRVLQRSVVQARQREVLAGLARGDFSEPVPGWFVLNDEQRYSRRFGLLAEGAVLDAPSLVQ